MPVNLVSGASSDINPRQDADDFVGLLQIVLQTEQPHVLRGQTAASFGERNVMVVMKILVCPTKDTLPVVAPPNFNFDVRRDEAVVG